MKRYVVATVAFLLAGFVAFGFRYPPVCSTWSPPICGPLTRDGYVVDYAGPCPSPPPLEPRTLEWHAFWEPAASCPQSGFDTGPFPSP